MFGGSATNPYDDIVAKTTDENLTTENWELIINLCDKVTDEGEEGAHNVIAALLKRLAHRNPNVQLYGLSVTDALSKNCGVAVNKEIASRAFTQGLEKLVTDRTTHDKVRKRALALVAQWTAEFEDDPSLGVMEDCYNNLKSKGYKFETPQEPLPPTVDDEIRRKEEEELQRVLEMSVQDRGGMGQWAQYSLASGASSGAGASGSSSAAVGSSSRPGASSSASGGGSSGYAAPKYQGGYVPARSPSPQRQPQQPQHQPPVQQPQTQPQSTQHHSPQAPAQEHFANYTHSNASNVSTNSIPSASTATATMATSQTGAGTIITRVKALHTFKPTESGELAFEKGDIIKVVDRGYKDWWRGQLKGRTGIFPVNYVEPMPEPTASELAREAEQEAAVFAKAVEVENLLSLLRAFDPAKDNLADNEEIQELYRSSMALRPKIVKLIDKYSQKRADLVSMNETFVRARTIFDRMMEESLARHTGVYDQPTYRPSYAHNPSPGPIRPDSRTGGRGRHDYPTSPGPTPSGYPGYAQAGPVGMPQAFPEPQPAPAATGYQQAPAGFSTATEPVPYGYGSPPVQVQTQPLQQPTQAVQSQHQPIQPLQLRQQQNQPQPQPQPQQQPQPQPAQQQPQVAQQSSYTQMANAPYTTQGPTPYPASAPAQQQQPQSQASFSPQVQDQPQVQPQYGQIPYQTQPQSQPQTSPHMNFQAQAQPSQQHAQPAIQQQPAQQPQVAQVLPQSPHATPYAQPQTQPLSQPQHHEPQLQPIQTLPAEQLQPVQQPVQQGQPAEQSQPTQPPIQQAQPAQQHQPAQAQSVQQQHQHQHQPSVQSGPPYVFDPKAMYSDPNVQAWAQYYAQGGTDLAGSVYFVSVPGLTDGTAASRATAQGVVAGQDGGSGQSALQSGKGNEGQQGYDYGGHQQQTVDSVTFGVQPSGSYFDASSTASQQQPAITSQQPTNTSSTSLGSTSNHNANVTLNSASPGGGTAPAHGPSPTITSTTPSWVLPKKDNSSSPNIGSVPGLTGRFAGVSLTDPGSASA